MCVCLCSYLRDCVRKRASFTVGGCWAAVADCWACEEQWNIYIYISILKKRGEGGQRFRESYQYALYVATSLIAKQLTSFTMTMAEKVKVEKFFADFFVLLKRRLLT